MLQLSHEGADVDAPQLPLRQQRLPARPGVTAPLRTGRGRAGPRAGCGRVWLQMGYAAVEPAAAEFGRGPATLRSWMSWGAAALPQPSAPRDAGGAEEGVHVEPVDGRVLLELPRRVGGVEEDTGGGVVGERADVTAPTPAAPAHGRRPRPRQGGAAAVGVVLNLPFRTSDDVPFACRSHERQPLGEVAAAAAVVVAVATVCWCGGGDPVPPLRQRFESPRAFERLARQWHSGACPAEEECVARLPPLLSACDLCALRYLAHLLAPSCIRAGPHLLTFLAGHVLLCGR
eukprot:gene5125-biopygen10476